MRSSSRLWSMNTVLCDFRQTLTILLSLFLTNSPVSWDVWNKKKNELNKAVPMPLIFPFIWYYIRSGDKTKNAKSQWKIFRPLFDGRNACKMETFENNIFQRMRRLFLIKIWLIIQRLFYLYNRRCWHEKKSYPWIFSIYYKV